MKRAIIALMGSRTDNKCAPFGEIIFGGLIDEISSKIVPGYCDDKELLNRLVKRKSNTTQDFRNGFVCEYNSSKGFGFIQSNGKDVFFHVSNCKFQNIAVGDKVEFRTENTTKGINAIGIKRISDVN